MAKIILFFLMFSGQLAGDTSLVFNSDEDEYRYYKIINEIRCPKCTSGSLASSNAPISEDLKKKIFTLIQQGYSDQEIKDYVVERYGKDSLYEPDFNENLILWLSPLFFLIFIVLVALFVRRR